MSEHQYFASNEKDDVEVNRLRLVEATYDPGTISRLERIGVSEGWNCLEVGVGAGSIAKWLSSRVGATGKVVATDINTRFVRLLNVPNLEIRRHNILQDELETGRYDIVHCRCLLMNIPEPEKGLKRMVDAIRPGGWLLIEEADYGFVLSTDVTNPSACEFISTLRAIWNFVRAKGILDPFFGRRVRVLLEQAKFVDVNQEGWTRVNRGGETTALLTAMTLQVSAKPMIAAGLLTQEQNDAVQRQFQDPSFYFPGATLFAAWGKRPTNEA